ncbi:MAG: DUF2889 domain-containing protein [Candidatus Rokuibacteriota bacterium]
MVEPALLHGRDRYERVMEGWIDNTHADALTHTVRLSDDDRALELAVVALPSPSYEIRAAAGRLLRGAVAPSVLSGVGRLAGVPMVGGLTRRAAEATGTGDGAALVVDAVIEVARLARQVAKLPRAEASLAAGGDPLECWRLDTTAWADLPDSCFSYSAAGRALLGPGIVAAATPDLYSPRAGQRRVFERRKVARLARAGARLRLFHSMHDNVHGFELTYEIDLGTGRIARAEHVTPRLPYAGVCSEPQKRMRAMLGETVDAGLRKRIQGHLGGVTGCAQLYDLTADLLKLLA